MDKRENVKAIKMPLPRTSEPLTGGLAYPATRRTEDFDDYHGTLVMDPYRWLEFTDNPDVVDWIGKQNHLTSEVLSHCQNRDKIVARLRELWRYPKTSLPLEVGKRTFVLETAPLQDQPILYELLDDPHGRIELLNPNSLATDGTTALTGWSFSRDGTRIAYALSRHGTDRQEIRVRDTATGVDYPETIRWSKSEEDLPFPNVAWHPDGSGFYYSRLPDPETVDLHDEYRYCQVYWHQLGKEQGDDRLVFERGDDPDLNFVPIVSDDGRYLVLHVWRGLSNRHQVYVRRIGDTGEFHHLFQAADARCLFLGNVDGRFFFHTNSSAPLGRVIGIDLERRDESAWIEIVPEQADPIARAALFDEQIVLVTVREGHHRVSLFDIRGKPGPAIELPGKGSVSEVRVHSRTGRLLVAYESVLEPRMILQYDIATGELVSRDAPPIPFDAGPYVTRHLYVTANDGARLPVTIVHRSGIELYGTNPLLLYGYGGFNVNITPTFDASRLLWLESGGIYAMTNVRGGGEFGEAWHEAGIGPRKQTVFDDFIAVAGWLIEQGYTTNSRLAISGESNGGLLVGACMLQRPELFGAVICSIPVTDMLRYPKFTIGHYWVPEYGNAESDQDQFACLHAYSPLHNVQRNVAYPPIFVTTGDHDDRVVPAHAMKFVAALQEASGPDSRPRLLRVQGNVGHGLGKPTSKVLELDVDIYAFLMAACNLSPS